jgi:hypothetical protein
LDKPSDKVERQAPQASSGELLFVAKTDDESLKPFSLLREEDIKIQKMAGKVLTDSYSNSRIMASFIVGEDNDTPRRNSALANAQGR